MDYDGSRPFNVKKKNKIKCEITIRLKKIFETNVVVVAEGIYSALALVIGFHAAPQEEESSALFSSTDVSNN